jgi:hypothetical protein
MIRFLCLLFMAALWLGCGMSATQPTRPKNVPPAAIWAGGPDGGNWFWCDFVLDRSWNKCSVYADVTGALLEKGQFQLKDEGRAAAEAELQFAYYSLGEIHLANNRTLVRIDVDPDREHESPNQTRSRPVPSAK